LFVVLEPAFLKKLETLKLPAGTRVAFDVHHCPVLLLPTDWAARCFGESNSGIDLSVEPPN
jgi:hypothetical protein